MDTALGEISTVTRMTIARPEPMRTCGEAQPARDGYDDPDAFIRAPIREVQVSASDEEVGAKPLESPGHGRSTPMTEGDRDGLRCEARRRHAAGQGDPAGVRI